MVDGGEVRVLCRSQSFKKNEVSQKSRHPPKTRKLTMVIPSIPCVMASFPKGAMSPQKAQAPNMDRWAMSGRLFFICFNYCAKVQIK